MVPPCRAKRRNRMKLRIDGVEIEVGSAAEAAELLAHRRQHGPRRVAREQPPLTEKRRGRPPKLQLVSVPTAPAAIVARSLDSVAAAPIDWLWRHRIPSGMVTVI